MAAVANAARLTLLDIGQKITEPLVTWKGLLVPFLSKLRDFCKSRCDQAPATKSSNVHS
jgi:hypothetical protein